MIHVKLFSLKRVANYKKKLSGFTLVEVLVVVAAIGILASIVTVTSTQVLRGARDSERSAKSALVASSLEKYYEKNNGYPSVASLVGQSANTLKNRLSLANPNSLIFPMATNTTNATIVASNPSPTQMAYFGATSNPSNDTQCQSDPSGYCDAFEIHYNNEVDGSLVVIESLKSLTPPGPPVPAPSTPTVSGSSISSTLVRITSSVVTCSTGTPEYKIRHAASSASLPEWTTLTWGTARTKDVNPGSNSTIYFQALARCVTATNSSTESQSTVQSVNVGTPPAAPSVSASGTSSSTIQLSWASVSGASSYNVTGPGTASSCASSPCTVTGLAASTSYTFYVTASNAFGTSSAGSASATTQSVSCTYPGTPTISASSTGTSSISVSWSGVSGNTPITYYVYYGTSSPGSNYYSATTSNSISVTGLSASTTYYLRIYAENSCGSSSYSNVATATTNTPSCSAPSVPTISADSSTSSSVSVSWGSASGATGYNVYYGSSSPGSTYYSNTSSTSMTVSGLSSSTTYYFRVVATNACGSSGYSNTASRSTSAPPTTCTAPSAPSGLTAAPDSSTSIDLSWGSSSGTTPITYSLSGTGAVSANSSTTKTSLSPSTNYSYTLTATNSCGSNSSSTSATTYGTISLNSGSVTSYANANVSWSRSGSYPSGVSYSVTSSGSNITPSCSSTGTSCTLNFSANCTGSAPTITVSAHGTSSSRGYTWPGSPGSPGASVQQRWHNSIRIDWSQGGDTSYSQVRYKQGSASSWMSAGDSLSPTATVGSGSLNADTVYDIAVYNSNCRYKHCDAVNSYCGGTSYLSSPSSSFNRRTCKDSASSPCGP